MKVYFARKIKGRKCTSAQVILAALELQDLRGLKPSHEESGAPVLLKEDGSPSDVHVSVTDTKNYILAALWDSPVGIDAEERGRKIKASSVRALHPFEQHCLEPLETGSGEWTEEFLHIWTAKESYSKLCTAGLRMGMSTFTVVGADGSYLDMVQKQGYPPGYMVYAKGPGAMTVCAAFGGAPDDISFEEVKCPFEPETSCIEAAAAILDARACTRAELTDRLQKKGYSHEESDRTAALMQERGYIDDGSYALSLANRLSEKNSGKRRILHELSKRGIDAGTAARALEQALEDGPSEEEKAYEAALRLWDPEKHIDENDCYIRPDDKIRGRIARKLSSLGFEGSIIWAVLEKIEK